MIDLGILPPLNDDEIRFLLEWKDVEPPDGEPFRQFNAVRQTTKDLTFFNWTEKPPKTTSAPPVDVNSKRN
jgi:hypothetical protein